jgi:hypothetical protein
MSFLLPDVSDIVAFRTISNLPVPPGTVPIEQPPLAAEAPDRRYVLADLEAPLVGA